MESLILAGDIGGTKVNIALFAPRQSLMTPLTEATYPTTGFANLEALLDEFLKERAGQVGAACFGVAGPIEGDRAILTNIAWRYIDAGSLRRHLRTDKVALLNDMMAMGYGTLALPPDRFLVLNEGAPDASGNAALIAAGTGLGEALLYWDGKRWRPSPSEGGHADFAPTDDQEIELLRYLHREFGHVSYERLVSGPGVYNIYRFLRDTCHGDEPVWLTERLRREDPSAVIAELALDCSAPYCREAMELFISIYGAEAGNMALKGLAFGGVFVGGGIAPKVLPHYGRKIFMDAFRNKGRLGGMMEKIPVKVMLEPKTPLLGAAHYAAGMLAGEL